MLRFKVMTIACLFTGLAFAQIPFDVVIDSARMKEVRDKKIMYDFNIVLKMDSITGNPKKGAKPDTMYTKYDREGRELVYSYVNDKQQRSYTYKFYDAKGRLVRKLSCDSDSSNGYVDYWTYNEKGQLLSELNCKRTENQESAFQKLEFSYDKDGRVSSHRQYGTRTNELDEIVNYYYSGEIEVHVGLSPKGDTQYVDSNRIESVAKIKGGWLVRYSYSKTWQGKYNRTLVSEYTYMKEDLGSRTRCTMVSSFYDYSTGALKMQFTDTTYADRHGNIIESRRSNGYSKYFWENDGSLDYFMRYNKHNQPLEKVTESFLYYE